MAYLANFSVFPRLPIEIRNLIWAQTLPGPRIINIVREQNSQDNKLIYDRLFRPKAETVGPNTKQPDSDTPQYFTNPCSYGGKHPIALSVCRESRREALRHLGLMFRTYWNFEIDYAYFEIKRGEQALVAMMNVIDLRRRGALERVRHVAFDWNLYEKTRMDENCFDIVRLLPNVRTCAFVIRYPPDHMIDVLDRGVEWKFMPATLWCNGRMEEAKKRAKERLTANKLKNAAEWNERQAKLEVTWHEISDRKFQGNPERTWPELPGEDWFG